MLCEATLSAQIWHQHALWSTLVKFCQCNSEPTTSIVVRADSRRRPHVLPWQCGGGTEDVTTAPRKCREAVRIARVRCSTKRKESHNARKKSLTASHIPTPRIIAPAGGCQSLNFIGLDESFWNISLRDGATLAGFDHAALPSGIYAAPTCLYQLHLRHHVRNSKISTSDRKNYVLCFSPTHLPFSRSQIELYILLRNTP